MAPIHPSKTGSRVRRDAGFTLTELLIVLAIIGLVLTAVPVLLQSVLPGTRALAAARSLANELRAARGRAIASGAPTDIRFDPSRRVYWTDPGAGLHALPDGIEIRLPQDRNVIAFYPDGSSSGGVVSLGGVKTGHRISVDWLTGQVALDD